jgi:hypothetical protein
MSDTPSTKALPRVRALATPDAAPRVESRTGSAVKPVATPETAARAMTAGPRRDELPAMCGGPSELVLATRRRAQALRATVIAALQHARKAAEDIDSLLGGSLTDEERAVYQVEGIDINALVDFGRRCRVLAAAASPAPGGAALASISVPAPAPDNGGEA